MPFRRAPSCATGPSCPLRGARLLVLERRDLPLVRVEPVLEPAHLLHRPSELRGHLDAPGPYELPGPLAEVPERAVQRAPRRRPVELPLPDEEPVNGPVPNSLDEVAEPHLPPRAAEGAAKEGSD